MELSGFLRTCSAAIQTLAIPFIWLARRERAASDAMDPIEEDGPKWPLLNESLQRTGRNGSDAESSVGTGECEIYPGCEAGKKGHFSFGASTWHLEIKYCVPGILIFEYPCCFGGRIHECNAPPASQRFPLA